MPSFFCKHQGGTRPPLTLIGPRGTARLMRAMMTTFPSFNRAPFRVTIREVSDRSFRLGETRISPTTVTHAPRLHCLGYRIEFHELRAGNLRLNTLRNGRRGHPVFCSDHNQCGSRDTRQLTMHVELRHRRQRLHRSFQENPTA